MDLTPDQIQQMISMLQSMLPKAETQEQPEEEFVSSIKTKKVSMKNNAFKNKFNNMPEKNMHKEDIAIDKKLSVSEPTPRRKANSLVEVQCRVCGKKEVVNGNLVIDKTRHKCNNCAAGAG